MNKRLIQWVAAAALCTLTSSVLAADGAFYRAKPSGSSVTIEGTSTVHDWWIKGNLIGGAMQLPKEFPTDKSLATIPQPALPDVTVLISVRRMDSSGGEKMNNVIFQAMKANDHPMIKYLLKEIKPANEGRKAGDPIAFNTKGDLTVAGVTKSVDMPITMESVNDGKEMKVNGSIKLKMTDYNIDPPAPKVALGLIKTGDDVTIDFEWMTEKK